MLAILNQYYGCFIRLNDLSYIGYTGGNAVIGIE